MKLYAFAGVLYIEIEDLSKLFIYENTARKVSNLVIVMYYELSLL